MSRLKQGNDDHPEAAGKHLDDAKTLLLASRADGAAYLAGYVIECSFKSLILVAGDKPWGHKLNDLGQDALRLAALPGVKTALYIPRTTSLHPIYDATSGWKEKLRYREPGAVTPADASSWLAEAQAVYESTIVPMRLDGVV